MVARTISPLISRSISRGISEMIGSAFDPISLFAAGEQGVWYDPSDMSTLFQDAAGTIPVTAAGQPVGMMRDKSGRGNHATQATATSRPILQTENGKWYLAFDGGDDGMVTAAVNFTATNKVTVFTGIRKNSDVANGSVAELSASATSNPGAFGVFAPANPGVSSFGFRSSGSVIPGSPSLTPATYPAPITVVLTGLGDISTDTNVQRINGAQQVSLAADQGTGNYGNYPIYIGRRGGSALPFNGNVYSLIIRGAASSAPQITDTENYVNSKTGAY